MVVVLRSAARPLVEVAFSRAGCQLPLWASRLDYKRSALSLRLLGFGVVVACEGLYICSELAPFERNPILQRILSEPTMLRRRRRRKKILAAWGDTSETVAIDRAVALIGKGYLPRCIVKSSSRFSSRLCPSSRSIRSTVAEPGSGSRWRLLDVRCSMTFVSPHSRESGDRLLY